MDCPANSARVCEIIRQNALMRRNALIRQNARERANEPSNQLGSGTVGSMDVVSVAQRFRENPIEVLEELVNHMKANELQVRVSADVAGGIRTDSVRLVLIVSEKEQVK